MARFKQKDGTNCTLRRKNTIPYYINGAIL